MKKECLTITRRARLLGKRLIETNEFELLSTGKDNIRYVDVIEEETTGRKTTYRTQRRRMDLETGNYINDDCYRWDDTQPTKAKKTILEWLELPYKETYKNMIGSTLSETRFIKEA